MTEDIILSYDGRKNNRNIRVAGASVKKNRVDVLGTSRPIEMQDSIWIEDLTLMGALMRSTPGKRRADPPGRNREGGDSIARSLRNALAAPIVTLDPKASWISSCW
jgi:hypothetical protein